MFPKTLPWLTVALLVLPHPALAAKKTEVRSLVIDPRTGTLLVTYRGDRPETTTFPLEGRLVVDLGRVATTRIPRRPLHPAHKELYHRVRFSQRPRQVVRVVFDTPHRLNLKLLDAPGRLILQPYPLQKAPAVPTQRPAALPPAEATVSIEAPPEATLSVEVTPPANPLLDPPPPPMLPESAPPLPTLQSPAKVEPGSSRLGIRAFTATYQESYLPGDAMVDVDGLDGLQGVLTLPVAGGLGRFDLSRVAYGFSDSNLPLSAHFRNEWHGRFEVDWSRRWGGFTGHLGGAYGVRWVQNSNTGASPGSTFVFATHQVYHGPAVTTGIAWEPAPSWEGSLRLSLSPWLLAHTDPAFVLPALSEGRWEVGASKAWGSLRAELGYRGWVSRGDQFEIFSAGPYLGVTMHP